MDVAPPVQPKPKKPMTGYQCFVKDRMTDKEGLKNLKQVEKIAKIAVDWKALTPEAQLGWKTKAQALKPKV